jgi:hypothetical protein
MRQASPLLIDKKEIAKKPNGNLEEEDNIMVKLFNGRRKMWKHCTAC